MTRMFLSALKTILFLIKHSCNIKLEQKRRRVNKTTNRADKRLTEMKTTFPQTPCYLMKASALQEAVAPSENPPIPSSIPRTPDANVSVFLADHLAKTVAPYLEKQMTELNEIV